MRISSRRRYVSAAGELDRAEGLRDAIDDAADSLADIQDDMDDIDEDSIDIMINNNISNHYIAECDECEGVFISAVVVSDQKVSSISGKCPLCGANSDQYLKWIVRDADDGGVDIE